MLRGLFQARQHTTAAFRSIFSPEKKLITHPNSQGGPQAWVTALWTQDRLGLMELDPTVFCIRPRLDIIYEVLRWHKECKRHGAESSLRRGDMGFSGRKMRKQKRTGRAPVSDRSAPNLHTGRQVQAVGPLPHDRSYKMPLNKRQLAIRSALSMRYAQDALHIVDDLEIPDVNQKKINLLVQSHGWESVLFVREEPSWKAYLEHSIPEAYQRNWDDFMQAANSGIENVKCVTLNEMTTDAIAKHKALVMTAPVARALEEQLHFI